MPPLRQADIRRLLQPRSVAVIGASPTPGALGYAVLANLDRHGFSGPIHLVNPKRDRIGDRPCVKSIADLPDGVDAAVLAIPGPAVLETIRALATKDVGAAVIFAAGFAEGGEAGLAVQTELARLAALHGMVLDGPNCLGMVNYVDGVALTFVETPAIRLGDRPGVAIVSQSGAMAVVLGTMLLARQLGISVLVSTGNEAASGVEDYVDHFFGAPHTAVIGMIVEQFRDPRRFLALAAQARDAGQTIVLLHPGKSIAARHSAATHTGAMAGDWQVMQTKVTHAGVILVDSLEELGDVIDIVLRRGRPAAGGTAVLTESGAFKAMTLDLAEAVQLNLPAPRAATAAQLRAGLPDFIPVGNPMDLTAQGLIDPGIYGRTLVPLLEDPEYSSIVLAVIQTDALTARRKLESIIAALTALEPSKPVVFAGLDEGADVPAELIAGLRRIAIPYLPTAERAMRALARLQAAAAIPPARPPAPMSLGVLPLDSVIAEHHAKRLLAQAGIAFPRGALATTPGEAKSLAAALGFPVALKAQSAAVSHKSDVGGVILGVSDEPAVAAGWDRLVANIGRHLPDIVLDGVLVEAMGARGTELIIGARNDPAWGPVILVGLGGVAAEALHDVRLLPPDLDEAAIIAELRKLRGAALFDGFRGTPPCDLPAVARTIMALGNVLWGTPRIREIDLNPVVVYGVGHGAIALDSLILTGEE